MTAGTLTRLSFLTINTKTYIEEVVSLAENLYRLSRTEINELYPDGRWAVTAALFSQRITRRNFLCWHPFIGLLDFPRTGLPEGQSYDIPTDRFGTDPEVWASFNPINHIASLDETSILVVFADEAFDRTMNENFTNALAKAGNYS